MGPEYLSSAGTVLGFPEAHLLSCYLLFLMLRKTLIFAIKSAPTVTAQRIEINGVECGDFASSLPMKTFQTIQNGGLKFDFFLPSSVPTLFLTYLIFADSIDAFSKYTDTDKGNRRPQGGGNNNNVVVNVNSGGDRFANDSIGEGSRVTKGYRHIFTGLENGDQITVIGHYNGQR